METNIELTEWFVTADQVPDFDMTMLRSLVRVIIMKNRRGAKNFFRK
jgi:hypothetical protein